METKTAIEILAERLKKMRPGFVFSWTYDERWEHINFGPEFDLITREEYPVYYTAQAPKMPDGLKLQERFRAMLDIYDAVIKSDVMALEKSREKWFDKAAEHLRENPYSFIPEPPVTISAQDWIEMGEVIGNHIQINVAKKLFLGPDPAKAVAEACVTAVENWLGDQKLHPQKRPIQ